MNNRFDDVLLSLMRESGGIKEFLENVFSVLARRTDFYVESFPGDKVGFPPEISEKMVFEPFNFYRNEYYKKFPKKTVEEYNEKVKEIKKKQNEIKIEKPTIEKKNQEIKETKPSDISTYNGGKNEKYIWSQNIHDVQVQIDLPQKTKGKELEVDLQIDYIKVYHKSLNKILLEGKLDNKIKVDDSTWSIEDGISLHLIFEKAEENIWKTVLLGDKEIDTSKVENTKSLDEFDDETQGALRKIVHEQKLKQAGLPSIEEQNTLDKLKNAWNSENSPFKGQEFDPSKFEIENGNIKFKG